MACLMAAWFTRMAVPVERVRAWPCAVAFLLDWLWFKAAWLTHSPAVLIYDVSGYVVEPWKLWAAGDAALGFFVFTKAFDMDQLEVRPWGMGVFLLLILQEFIHLWLGHITALKPELFPVYGSLLNATFGLQVICLMLSGGSGVRMRLDSYYARRFSLLGLGRHKAVRASDEEAR